jgi:signal-transduction protein with cAMP-binding, CBS, and nucleotidyltransferase domain
MRLLSELMEKRDIKAWSVGPQDSVFSALQVLSDRDVGALMVIENGKLVGVFSERDYTRKIALSGRSSKDTKVQDIMTSQVLTVTAKTRTRDCMALMSQKKIRHLPVMDGDRAIGMISIRDIMDDIISDHELTISQLQSYIAS